MPTVFLHISKNGNLIDACCEDCFKLIPPQYRDVYEPYDLKEDRDPQECLQCRKPLNYEPVRRSKGGAKRGI